MDACQICHGSKGGVPGNENVVDGLVICDYCLAELMGGKKFTLSLRVDNPRSSIIIEGINDPS